MASSARPLRCLVTGGAGGLGLEVARQLLQRGHEVMIACRDPQRGEAAVAALQQQHASPLAPPPTAAAAPAAAAATQAAATHAAAAGGAPRVSAVPCDLASFDSVRACAAAVRRRWPAFDVLVCNAAVVPRVARRTADGADEQLQVNHLSHVLLVHLLLPCLVDAASSSAAAAAAAADDEGAGADGGGGGPAAPARSRVVMVGSLQHAKAPPAFQDPASLAPLLPPPPARGQREQQQHDGPGDGPGLSPMQLYAVTKLCNLWFASHLASEVLPGLAGPRGAQVVANTVSPGFIPSTGLGRHLASGCLARLFMRHVMPLAPFAVSLQEGGARVVAACVGDDEGRASGRFFSRRRPAQPSDAARDGARAARCFALSCAAVGVRDEAAFGRAAAAAGSVAAG